MKNKTNLEILKVAKSRIDFPLAEGDYTEQQILKLAKKAYQEGDANFPIVKDNCALLVIDMQDEFVKPRWTPYWVPEATRQVPRIKSLLDHFRENKIPVIFIVFSRTHTYLDRPSIGSYMPNRYPELDIDQSSFFVEGHVMA